MKTVRLMFCLLALVTTPLLAVQPPLQSAG